MSPLAVAGWAALGIPVGWLAWRLAQFYIDRRDLEEGDIELRLPWYRAVVLEVAVFGGLAWRFQDNLAVMVVYLGLFAGFTALLLVDFGRYYLPDRLVALTLLIGLAGVAVASAVDRLDPESTFVPVKWALIGVVVNFVMYFLFWLLAQIVFGARGLGFGDVKLAAPLGLAIGWLVGDVPALLRLSLWALLIGFASGAISGVLLLRGPRLRRSFPQGPFLVLGTFVVIVCASSFIG